MFKGIKLKVELPSPEEGHTFLIGFFEVLCPWKPRSSPYGDDSSPVK